jgi:hypothetical protein
MKMTEAETIVTVPLFEDGQGDLGLLRGLTGNTIILITDGRQECQSTASPNCLTISQVLGDLVERKIRVVTIALGDEVMKQILRDKKVCR